MKRVTTWWILIFVMFVAFASSWTRVLSQEEPADEADVDLGAFTKEIMVLRMEGDQTQLAMWFPFEFFVEANRTGSDQTRGEVEKEVGFLSPYHCVIVQCSLDREDGSSAYASKEEVRARTVLKLEGGEQIEPLDKVPPLVSATVEAMKTIMAAEGDEGGANMHVLVFPATGEDGKAIVDTTKKDKLTLVLNEDERFKEAVLIWHTPFDATTPVPPCAKCKQVVSAKWSYCPWCGGNLEER